MSTFNPTLLRRFLTVAAATLLLGGGVRAQEPMRLLVGFPAGGTFDVAARTLAEKLRPRLGVVIVENRPGANQTLVLGELKRSAPDGKTLALVSNSPFVILPHLQSKLPYDPVQDFTPIGRVLTMDMLLATGPATPARTLGELITWFKANPAQANYGTPGAGTGPHFIGTMLGQATGVPLNHIPYKGGAPALTDLMGGQIPLLIDSPLALLEQSKAGRVRILASAGENRSPALPETPTLLESGYAISGATTLSIYAPAGLAADKLATLSAIITEAASSPEFREMAVKNVMLANPSSPAELRAEQAKQLEQWAAPVKASGFRLD